MSGMRELLNTVEMHRIKEEELETYGIENILDKLTEAMGRMEKTIYKLKKLGVPTRDIIIRSVEQERAMETFIKEFAVVDIYLDEMAMYFGFGLKKFEQEIKELIRIKERLAI